MGKHNHPTISFSVASPAKNPSMLSNNNANGIARFDQLAKETQKKTAQSNGVKALFKPLSKLASTSASVFDAAKKSIAGESRAEMGPAKKMNGEEKKVG
jgi:hypothetical protein